MPRSTPQPPSAQLLNAITEREFQTMLVQYARLCGWLTYHTFDSRRSDPGFPDLVMVRLGDRGAHRPTQRDDRIIIAELKRERGRVSVAQTLWLEALTHTGKVEVYTW